ncbi:M15 family metallopeptidase [Microbacterium sp.]|uniref:M15 family metallopeptidase n=1 Tax=Microbacterium sp. TaxID=51671 RepID=UPI002810B45A|nr:M15 family metallopeptidase [Microbacterium sp.]
MHSTSARTRDRRLAAVVATVITALVALVFAALQALSAVSAVTPGEGPQGAESADVAADGRIDGADGYITSGQPLSVFDDAPAVANLDPQLLEALRAAATDAAQQGVEFEVNGGWRSAELQQKLLSDAEAKYGSAAEAARWVATPEASEHVTGDAVDVGPWKALDWLVAHGAQYGLCQIYGNEAWHYEFRADAPSIGCPAMYRDPTERTR